MISFFICIYALRRVHLLGESCADEMWNHTVGALAQVRYDAELAALRSGVERVIVELVVGPKSTAATRKAILPHMDDLAAFLGRRSATNVHPHRSCVLRHVTCDQNGCMEAS